MWKMNKCRNVLNATCTFPPFGISTFALHPRSPMRVSPKPRAAPSPACAGSRTAPHQPRTSRPNGHIFAINTRAITWITPFLEHIIGATVRTRSSNIPYLDVVRSVHGRTLRQHEDLDLLKDQTGPSGLTRQEYTFNARTAGDRWKPGCSTHPENRGRHRFDLRHAGTP